MRLIAYIICFLSWMSLFAYDLEVEGIYYNANIEKMELTITSGDIPYSGVISIPESVEYKGRTFSVVEIGRGAFENSSIESVKVPGSIKTIEYDAFQGCTNLKEVKLSDGLTRIDDSFRECSSLAEISIPNTVRSISEYAFWHTGLTKLIIEDGEQELGLGAYGSSGGSGWSPFEFTKLEYVYIGRTLNFWNAKYGPFNGTKVTEAVIGPQVESLPDYCFANLDIKHLTIPAGVKKLGRSCLRNEYLEELRIEDSDQSLYWSLYSNLPNLKKLYYGRNLTIEKYNTAFSECTKLMTLSIGENVTDFYSVSFAGDLQTIYNYAEIPATLSQSPFNSRTFLNATLFVPYGSVDAYSKAEVWKNFWEIKEWNSSGISDVLSNDIEIKVVSGGIICSSGGHINVFSINGVKVYSNGAVSGEFITLDCGLYIVQYGNMTKKIVVK